MTLSYFPEENIRNLVSIKQISKAAIYKIIHGWIRFRYVSSGLLNEFVLIPEELLVIVLLKSIYTAYHSSMEFSGNKYNLVSWTQYYPIWT